MLLRCPTAIHQYGGAYNFGSLGAGQLIPPHSQQVGEGSSRFCSTQWHSQYVVGIEPGNSGMIVDYHVDEFTHT